MTDEVYRMLLNDDHPLGPGVTAPSLVRWTGGAWQSINSITPGVVMNRVTGEMYVTASHRPKVAPRYKPSLLAHRVR